MLSTRGRNTVQGLGWVQYMIAKQQNVWKSLGTQKHFAHDAVPLVDSRVMNLQWHHVASYLQINASLIFESLQHVVELCKQLYIHINQGCKSQKPDNCLITWNLQHLLQICATPQTVLVWHVLWRANAKEWVEDTAQMSECQPPASDIMAASRATLVKCHANFWRWAQC